LAQVLTAHLGYAPLRELTYSALRMPRNDAMIKQELPDVINRVVIPATREPDFSLAAKTSGDSELRAQVMRRVTSLETGLEPGEATAIVSRIVSADFLNWWCKAMALNAALSEVEFSRTHKDKRGHLADALEIVLYVLTLERYHAIHGRLLTAICTSITLHGLREDVQIRAPGLGARALSSAREQPKRESRRSLSQQTGPPKGGPDPTPTRETLLSGSAASYSYTRPEPVHGSSGLAVNVSNVATPMFANAESANTHLQTLGMERLTVTEVTQDAGSPANAPTWSARAHHEGVEYVLAAFPGTKPAARMAIKLKIAGVAKKGGAAAVRDSVGEVARTPSIAHTTCSPP
jgi:hypothetical protein